MSVKDLVAVKDLVPQRIISVPFGEVLYERPIDNLEKILDDNKKSIEKTIGKTIEENNKAIEKSIEKIIEDKVSRKFNFFMIVMAISLTLTMAVFFYLQGEIFATNIELAQLNTNFNYFVTPPSVIESVPIVENPPLTVNATGIP